MTNAHFRFSSAILRRLGEELNPSPEQGILELVKNSYDANARKCTVELIDTDAAGGTIRVVDDGDGMTSEKVVDGWLVIGSSSKNTGKKTRLGRTPAGSKGLGRLAALRMGSAAKLVTVPRGAQDTQVSLRIDWDEYEDTETVEDVTLPVRTKKLRTKEPHGSSIEVDDLRSKIGRNEVKRLARALILLADPFGDDPHGFSPTLQTSEFEEIAQQVKARYFEDADYHLSVTLNEKGRATAKVTDWRGKQLFSATHKELAVAREGTPYESPPAKFDIWIFLLDGENFSTKQATLTEVRSWLGSFGGVHIYHNGLRVAPYGNPGNDWLDMNVRRVQSPEERPGTNTSIGRVQITDPSAKLIQKTDRSGFIEDSAFTGLRACCHDALEWLAKSRLEVAEVRRQAARQAAPKKSRKSKVALQQAIEGATKATRAELKEKFDSYERSRDKEVKQLQREVQLYRTLSTAGITAATFAHESTGSPIKLLTQATGIISRRYKDDVPKGSLRFYEKAVASLKSALKTLSAWSSATLQLIDHQKRRIGRVEVHDVVGRVAETFEPFLLSRDIELELDLCSSKPYLRGAEAALESIVANLLNNSIAALESPGARGSLIRVRTEIEDGFLHLSVADSGPGIQGITLRQIWLPGQTTRPNGTGLGLTIVRDAAKDLAGKTEVEEDSDLGGAEFKAILPLLGH